MRSSGECPVIRDLAVAVLCFGVTVPEGALVLADDGDPPTILPLPSACPVQPTECPEAETVCPVMETECPMQVTLCPPFDLTITFLEDLYREGGPQGVSGDAKDHDLVYGDSLTYNWYSNRTGHISNGKSLNLSLWAGFRGKKYPTDC